MLLALDAAFSQPPNRVWVRPRALQETTVPPDRIAHAVLCSPMKLCIQSAAVRRARVKWTNESPAEAKTMGLSGRDGSVRQKTSARPSEASLRCGANVPVILLWIETLTT